MKKLLLTLMLTMVCMVSYAQEPVSFKLKGDVGKGFWAVEEDGNLYTLPKVLEYGKKWKIKEIGENTYIVTGNGDVKVPTKTIKGKKYIDFSFFANASGLTYERNTKKKFVNVKIKKTEESKKNEMPVILWDPDRNFDVNKKTFTEAIGRRIISPSWGSYKEANEEVTTEYNYLKTLRERNFEVMPLIHNDFNPEETGKFLNDRKAQEQFIKRVVSLSEVYGFEGYNIDFENMNYIDKDKYTDFIKDLSNELHNAGKEISVDITVYNEYSKNWSLCYDRKALGAYVDYEILMGYDQTSGASKEAGSVSSYAWLDKNISVLLTQVPKEKLILGLPLYTRVWIGEKGKGTAHVLTIKNVEEFIKRHRIKKSWNDLDKQYVSQFRDKGNLYTVWFEEVDSLDQKISLLKKYELAGMAFWRSGFESENLFSVLENHYLNPKSDKNFKDVILEKY